jgi:signal transduction histidine kinase
LTSRYSAWLRAKRSVDVYIARPFGGASPGEPPKRREHQSWYCGRGARDAEKALGRTVTVAGSSRGGMLGARFRAREGGQMATGETAARRGADPGAHGFAVDRGVVERLPFGLVIVHRERGTLFANRIASEILADDGARIDAFTRRLFESDADPERELVPIGRRTVSLRGVPARGEETAIVLLADVTERERRERAERDFIENAAHELRTPVAAIIGVVEALEEGGKEIPEVRDRFLGHLRVHGTRLVQLSTSLLALARVQSRAEAPRVELVAIRALLDTVAARVRPLPGVSLVVDVSETLAALGDEELLLLALTNVVDNAVKNTAAGEIRLVARMVAPWAELEISDTGPGMSKEDLEAALVRFHRGANHGPGFGLGLAIATDAVEAGGGTLALESTPGVGTRARIRLPGAEIH